MQCKYAEAHHLAALGARNEIIEIIDHFLELTLLFAGLTLTGPSMDIEALGDYLSVTQITTLSLLLHI